ncbi:MAG: T9SS type A sorting domain-containing protein, partial [Calditrichaeota bacterium]|nr:T9SS type A sorting domain-containing protein [Calditrichota bacterium]
NMWLTTRSARGKVAWQFNLNFETWEVELIQNFVAIPQVPGTGYDALGHDGEDLWVEAFGIEVVYIVEDGLNERGWISWRPEEGVIDPDEESVVVLNLDARGVMPGEYAAELYFYSNDAIEFEDPDVIVDISLTISGNANIHVTPGGEDEDPLDFEIAYFGFPISQSVIVTNTGVDALALQTITRDEDNPDFYVEQDDLEGFILDQNEERELTIWYNANPERGGVQEATLLFETNADGWRDGYPVRCVASIGAFESPVLELNPQVINVDLREEQEQEFVISARNTGGSNLVFEAEVVVIEQPGDDNAQLPRQVRTVNQNPGPAPFRDDPRGRGILIQESCGWFDYDFEQHFQNVENLEYDRFRTWDEIDQVDLSDYDFMWIGNCETEAWVAEHNQNLERIESFVNRGGVIYHSSSHFREAPDPRPINPGGLIYTGNNQIRDRIATIQLDPEENFLINYMNENDPEGWEWGSGQEITSLANIVSIGYFSEEDINEIDNSAGYEIIAVGSDNNEPIILTYQYGAGVCIVNTMIDGYHHNDPNSCQWGRTGEAIIHYMDEIFMRGSAFILEPTDGEIGPDRDMDVFLRLDGEFFREGETRLAVHFYSNDQENPDQIIEVTVASDGIPEIDGMPELFPLENAEVIEFDDFHTTNREYSVPFNVRNRGTSDLIINDVTVSDPDNYEIMGIENEMIILPQEVIEGQIIFHPVNAGELDCRITLSTNARNVENGEVWWNITGDAVHSADIDVALPGGRESVVVFSTPDAEPVDRNWSISNLTPENGDDLEFRISIDDVEEVGNRDGNVRRVRQIENSIPCRDELGDILSEFQLPLEWYSGLTTDGEFLYLTESRGNEPGLLYVVSIAEERVVAEYEIQSWCFSIEFDGENLWIATFNSPEIRIYTRDGDQIGQFNAEQVSTYSMASDQTEFVYMKKINNPIYVYSIADREFVGTINHQPGFNNDAEVAYIMCAPSQADGSIWGFARNHGYRARINGNRLENVQQFNFNEMIIWSDVAHDGENIWYSNRGLATCMDDGIMDIRPDWLSVEPTDGVIAPGNQVDLTFTLNPAGCEEGEVLETTAVIATNDPLSPIVEIPVTLSLDPTPLRHFTADNPRTREVDGWVEDNAAHTITVTSVEFNGRPVPLDWEIGVFTPEGALAGGAVWRDGVSAEFPAYGNSNEFEEITGFRVGEGFTFMVWDHVEDEEHPAEIEFIEGPEDWNRDRNTTVALGLFGNRNLILQLAQSWNMISLNVDPQEFYSENDDRGPQIITMFEQLRIDDENHRVELLKNEIGRFWTPDWGFINIPYWELTEGYQIKLTEDSEAEFSGSPIEFDTDIPLNPGWNISSYFPDYELDACAPDFYVLSPIIDFVELAKDDIGRFMTPEFIFSNMEPWRETKGYQVKIAGNEGVVLNYPPDREDEVIAGVQDIGSELQTPALRTSENMSLLINSFDGLVDDGDQIYAIGTSGRILGTGIVRKSRCGLAIWGNDLSTEGGNGASEGEAFTLKQKKSGSNIEESLTIRQLLEGDELRYQKDGFIVLDAAIESALPTEFYISKNYPNPFNSTTTLTYGIPERANVNINIYDISGRFVESLINTEVNPGHHKITWSPREAPTGIYIVRCVAGWKKESLKVALIR